MGLRVLRPGGVLLNFDADYGAVDFTRLADEQGQHAHADVDSALLQEGEDIRRALPLSRRQRPQWDMEALARAGIGELTLSIFTVVRQKPERADEVRKFMNYYLPTTLKMLSGYSKMNERNVTGQQAQETRRQIESAAAVVEKAFKKQLNNLYQDDILDISTDVEVLETLLKADGLTDTGMQAMTGSQK